VRREPPRQGEIQRNYSLIDKARSTLGYAPQVTLEDGLRRTWEWFASAEHGDGPHAGTLPGV
jgi:UDP-glucose 4-epimerase